MKKRRLKNEHRDFEIKYIKYQFFEINPRDLHVGVVCINTSSYRIIPQMYKTDWPFQIDKQTTSSREIYINKFTSSKRRPLDLLGRQK